MTAPSVEDVMCRVSSRWPAIFCVGAIEATSQESMAAPAIEPTAPPIAAAETPRKVPPTEPPIAVPAAARMIEAMGSLGYG
jgi:hypothetical protein